jgi:hypothetical protein
VALRLVDTCDGVVVDEKLWIVEHTPSEAANPKACAELPV